MGQEVQVSGRWLVRRLALLAALAFLGLVISCGSDDGRASEPTTAAVAGPPFFSADGGYPTWAATEAWLVGFSGSDLDRPEVVPRYGIRALAGGATTPLDPPATQGRFEPTSVIGNRDTAAVLGIICDPEPADGGCVQGRLAGFTIDPTTESWTPLDVAEDVAATPVRAVHGVQPVEDGWLLIARHVDGTTNSLLEVSEDSVRLVVAGIPVGRNTCVMGDHIYVQGAEPQGGDLMADGKLGVTRTPLTQPAAVAEPVPLPPVSASIGGISVQMACDSGHVYLTSSKPVPGKSNAATYAFDGTTWTPRADLVPNGATLALTTLSSAKGAAIVWSTAPGDVGQVALTSPDGSGRTVEAPGNGIGQWQDHTGTIVFTPSDFGSRPEPLPSIDVA